MSSPIAHPTAPTSQRIRAIDWLRGIAVLFMVQCHALALLRPELRKTAVTAWLLKVDGLVAPAFIFSAGFALALLNVRSAADGAQRARLMRNLRRIAEVLALATLVNWMWFPLLREPKWLLRLDILHCVGLCLLLVLPAVAALARRPGVLAGSAFTLALAVFAVSPLAESVTGFWAMFLNKSTGAVFPLLPWLGFAWLGVFAGTIAAAWGRAGLVRALLFLLALGIAGTLAADWLYSLYPPHKFFVTNPSNQAARMSWVCVALLGLLALEARRFAHPAAASAPPSRVRRFVEVFGTSSLSAYFFHEALLFYRTFGLSFQRFWGDRSGWAQYAVLTVALIALTYLLCLAVDPAERALKRGLSHVKGLLRRRPPGWEGESGPGSGNYSRP
ncbi:heparan-alpha-glucosaminide N-acetyltransferase domain-containing protein [Myxococcaceae bacterium GXIMD 01537]